MHARSSVYLIVIHTYYHRRTPCRSPCSREDRSWRRATLPAYRSDQSNSEVLPKDKIATNAVEVLAHHSKWYSLPRSGREASWRGHVWAPTRAEFAPSSPTARRSNNERYASPEISKKTFSTWLAIIIDTHKILLGYRRHLSNVTWTLEKFFNLEHVCL